MRRPAMVILVLAVLASAAAASPDGGTQSPFALGVGARELSLGAANLAGCDFATAPVWNASRLTEAEVFSLSGFHTRLFDSDASYQYLGLVAPTMDYGVFALGLSRIGVSGIERRDSENLLLGEFEDSRLALNLAYARMISRYRLGLVLTVEHHSLDSYSATSTPGLNLSIGRRFDFGADRRQYLAVILNGVNVIRPGLKLVEDNVSYPYRAEIGLSLGLMPFSGLNHRLTLSASLVKIDHLDPRFNAGLEYGFDDLLFVRGGLRRDRLSLGTGLEYKRIRFDYALVDRDLGSLHMFTVTTSFGTPTSVRRADRIKRREADFNGLMNQRLTSRNQEMIDQLVAHGENVLADGNLNEAAHSFDRALFLARSSGLDTVGIAALTEETGKRQEKISRELRYRQNLDSARVNLAGKEYLAAVHFANLARSEMPRSSAAADVLREATEAMERNSSLAETIRRGLWQSDSLLSYGHIDKALAIVKELRQLAPDDDAVGQAVKKAEFERWKALAISAHSAAEYGQAEMALDSALALYPAHQWCLNMRKRIADDARPVVDKIQPKVPAVPQRLSAELEKQVEQAYGEAQEHFTKGNLTRAIEQWETVWRLAPDYQSVRQYLINAYKFVGVDLYGQNRLAEAVAVWQKAAGLDPDNTEIRGYIRRTEAEIRKLSELSYDHQ